MTQEQKINRGTIIIFILSIVLVICLCATATLAYFAGNQKSNATLILGGPVRVSMVKNNNDEIYGKGNLVMNIYGNRDNILPGIGIDVQAIAKLTSSDYDPTRALLRALLDISVTGISPEQAKKVEYMIRRDMGKALTGRIDGTSEYARDGWVLYEGDYYYCSKDKQVDPKTNEEYIVLCPISTLAAGYNITFINGTFQFPQDYTNEYANVEITFCLTFQAIQEVMVNENNKQVPATIPTVKSVLDTLDWSKHND